jgi:hypothetical protein
MIKKLSIILIIIATIVYAVEYYRLDSVKRIDQDMYGNSEYLLVTKYCYHYSYGEDVVLKWYGPYSSSNEIIWDDGSKCNCSKVIKR